MSNYLVNYTRPPEKKNGYDTRVGVHEARDFVQKLHFPLPQKTDVRTGDTQRFLVTTHSDRKIKVIATPTQEMNHCTYMAG